MVIDFHTHIFPDALAARAIGGLEQSGNVKSVLSGRREDLLASMKRAGVDYSLNLPIASRPKQVESINSFAISVNGRDGLFSLGGIHPLYENYREELKRIRAAGLIGVKLHPDFQGLFIDDEPMVELMEACRDLGLLVLVHGGMDVSFPHCHHCTPERIARILPRLEGLTLVLAHLGGYNYLDDVERLLVGKDLYLDTSFTLGRFGREQILRIIRNHSPDRLLFGTDSPWDDQQSAVSAVKDLPIDASLKDKILYENAAGLLKLE